MLSFTLIFSLFRLCLSLDLEVQAKYESLSREEFIKYFNAQGFSWTATYHPHLEGMIFNCSIPEDFHDKYPSVVHESIVDLPKDLDARQKWPNCPTISDIYEQGKCGSCWTFGMTTTASDRLCIKAGKTVRLSQQDLACCTNCVRHGVCDGGSPHQAFTFWSQSGLVSQECRPYNVDELKNGQGCKQQCVNGADYNSDKQYGAGLYTISADEGAIKTELFTNGPIKASMVVFEDFRNFYQGGIYEYKFGDKLGRHSVRIIGYGEENNIPYWIGANSWGPSWGEEGFFRIKRFQPNIDFESALYTADPKQ